MSSQRRLRLLDFMSTKRDPGLLAARQMTTWLCQGWGTNAAGCIYTSWSLLPAPSPSTSAASSAAAAVSRGPAPAERRAGPPPGPPTGPSPPLRTSAARGAAAREGGGAGSSHRRCHWLRGTDSCEPAPSRGGRGHGPSLFRHGGRSTVHCVTRGLLAPGWRATRCWNPALDGQNGSRAGRLPPPPWRELCYGSPAPAGRSSVLFPPRHRSAGVVSGRRRCCLQDDPAGAGLAAHQGESGGRLPRYALGRGGGRPPVASTGRAAAWLGWAGAGRAGSGLAWPGLAWRCVWVERRARPCLCLPQFTRYSALLVGMIYGKKRYGECGAPGGLFPSPARPTRAPWGGRCGPRSRGPGRHCPPPRCSRSCPGLAEVVLREGLAVRMGYVKPAIVPLCLQSGFLFRVS